MKARLVNKPSMPFAWMPKNILNDTKISLKAKALWAYINDKPVGWDFCATRIAQDMKEDRKAILRGINELKEAGYIRAEKQKDGRIRFAIKLQRSNRGGN